MRLCIILACVFALLAAGPAFADAAAILEQIATQQNIIAAGSTAADKAGARAKLKGLLKDLATEQGYEDIEKTTMFFVNTMNDLKGPLEDYYTNYNRLESLGGYIPKEMQLAELASEVKGFKEFVIDGGTKVQVGGNKYDVGKLKAVMEFGHRMGTMSDAFSSSPEPAGKKLGGNLRALGSLMSTLGGDVPLIGAILTGYGDVITGMMDALDNLEANINQQNPWVNAATRGAYGNHMLLAWDHQVGEDLTPVLGLRDVYYESESLRHTVWLFDSAGKHTDRATGKEWPGNFIPISRMAPFDGLSYREIIRLVRQRYFMFHKAGIENPTVDQILWEANKVVALDVEIDHSAISPGGGFPIRVVATRALDGTPMPRDPTITCVVRQEDRLLGDQEEECVARQFLTWKAPGAAGKYAIAVDLTDAAKKAGWRSATEKPVEVPYIVGEPVFLNLKVQHSRVPTTMNAPLKFLVSLANAAGEPLTRGTLIVRTDPPGLGLFAVPDPDDPDGPVSLLNGPLSFTGRAGDRNELLPKRMLGLMPPDGRLLPAGAFRIIAEYQDTTTALLEKQYRQKGTAAQIVWVQEPVETESAFTLSAAKLEDGRYRITALGNTPDARKITAGQVRLTARAGTLETVRGPEPSAEKAVKAGAAVFVWRAPAGDPERAAFLVQFSGGAMGDLFLLPHETELSVALAVPSALPVLLPAEAQPEMPGTVTAEVVAESVPADPKEGFVNVAVVPSDFTPLPTPDPPTPKPAIAGTVAPLVVAPAGNVDQAAAIPPVPPVFAMPKLEPGQLPHARMFPGQPKPGNPAMGTAGRPPDVPTERPAYVRFTPPEIDVTPPAGAKEVVTPEAGGQRIAYMLDGQEIAYRLVTGGATPRNNLFVRVRRGPDPYAPHGTNLSYEQNGADRIRKERVYDMGTLVVAFTYVNDALREEAVVTSREPWTMRAISFRPDGALLRIGYYRDGKEHGVHRTWWPDGQPLEQMYYEDGMLRWKREFAKNGQLVSEAAFDTAGKRDGYSRTWTSKGEPAGEAFYVNGVQQGLSRQWYGGLLSGETHYRDGKKLCEVSYGDSGRDKEVRYLSYFNETGKTSQQIWWKAGLATQVRMPTGPETSVAMAFGATGAITRMTPYGKTGRHGEEREWHEDPHVLASVKHYANDKEHGVWLRYHVNGTKVAESNYVNGLVDGEWRWWYPSGKPRELGFAVNGKTQRVQEWYETGQLQRDSTFTYAGVTQTELALRYAEDGKLVSRLNYRDGRQHGKQEHWAPDGTLTVEFYLKGKPVSEAEFRAENE